MMTNITKEFQYNIADDIYSQTNELIQTATATYNGPAKKYAVVDAQSNKLTSATITEEQFETFNDNNEDFYAVEIDCNGSDTVICAMLDGGINPIGLPEVSEDIPGSDDAFVRTEPVLPSDTYELKEIQYDRSSNAFVRPLPWKAPEQTWQNLIGFRNVTLSAADRTLSEDMPESLYNKVAEYKQYLRDLPVTFGGHWNVIIASAGTGYTVGDRILVTDPSYKNGQSVGDILLTVSSVDDNGGITAVDKSNAAAYEYHKEAGTYNNVFTVQSATGTGATFNLSKVATVPAFKIVVKTHPLQ